MNNHYIRRLFLKLGSVQSSLLLPFLLMVSPISHADTFYGDRYNQQDLGKGYHSNRYHLGQPCLSGDIIFTPKSKGTLNFLSQLTDTDVREQTFGEIHGGVNIFIASGSASTSITHNVAKDDLSANLSMHMNLDYGYDTLENRIMDTAQTSTECGDSYVYQIDYGRDIFLTAKLHFNSLDEYKKFVTKITVRVLFVKKSWTKTKIIKKFAQNAVLTINVASNGVLPHRLQSLVDENPTACRGLEIEKCIDTYHLLSQYLFDQSGLISDLDTIPKPVRSAHMRTYQESGHYALTAHRSEPDPILFEMIQSVEARYGELVRLESRTKAFYETSESEIERVVRYTEWQSALNNRDQFATLRDACFTQPSVQLCDVLD